MRPLKWILIAAAGLVALLLAGVLAVTQWVDPNVFKPRIVAALREATGRKVELQGDLELAWFPWLALRAGAGSLGNPPGFDGAPLARWREARLGARLLPLLRGEFELDRVRFEGLEIELRRDRDGHDNWSGLADGAGGQGGSRPLRLAGLDLRDARFTFVDGRDGTRLALEGLQLTSGAYAAGQATPLALEARFDLRAGPGAPPLLTGAELETSIGLPQGESDVLALGRTRFAARVHVEGLARDGVPLSVALRGATLDPAASVYAAPEVDVSVGAARLALRELRYAQAGDTPPEAGMAFALAPTSLRALLVTLGIEPPVTTDPRVLGEFGVDGRLALQQGLLRIDPLNLLLDETRLAGRLERGGEPPLAQFTLAGNSIDLDRYLEPEGTPGEPFRFPGEALGALRARGSLTFDTAIFDALKFEGLTLRLLLDERGLHGAPPVAADAARPRDSAGAAAAAEVPVPPAKPARTRAAR